MVLGFGKKKEEIQMIEQEREEALKTELFKQGITQSFQDSPDNPVEFLTTIIEPAATNLYGSQKVIVEEDMTPDGKKQYSQTIKDQIKILRDLPLGNFNPNDEMQITTLIEIAENCDDMGFYEAADYYVKTAYMLVNASRARGGFLQKQLATKSIELSQKKEEKKKGGVLTWGS